MVISKNILPIHKRFDISFTHGEGPYLFSDSKKYLDFGAGIAVNSLGHCHPKLVKAITDQANKLWHVSNLYNIKELNNFAEKLVSQTFADYVFFCNSGAEAVECSIKMIRNHFYNLNQSHRYRIITFTGAFHGRTMATISAAGKEKYIQSFEPTLPGFDNVEFGNIEAVKKAIGKNTAGILIEPIQGEEGIRVSNPKFIEDLRKVCNDHDLLLAFDEVQCGVGRTGYLFAYQHYGVNPDIIASAKAIGGGFPLGACLATKHASKMGIGSHGTTYGGNPLAMAVANAVLDEMLMPNFFENVQVSGNFIRDGLEKLKTKFPQMIDEIRGVGLMIGVKMNQTISNLDMVSKLIEENLLTVPAGENVIRILPPLNITKDHCEEALNKFDKALTKLSTIS